MEPVLTNHCRSDKTTLEKAFTWTTRVRRRVLLGFALVFLGLAILGRVLPASRLPILIPFLFAIVYTVLAFLLVPRATRLQLRRMEETYQSDHVDATVVFHPEELASGRDGAEPLSLRYGSLKAVKALPGLIVLLTKTRQFILLDPARFENGAEADFWKLMNEKCPQALPKKYRQ